MTVEKVSGKKDKEEFIEPEIINKAIAPVDTQLNIVVIVPGKKKLQVVHINELGGPVEEPSAMAHKTETHSFQLKLASQEVFVNPLASSRKTGFTILTAKNSPN